MREMAENVDDILKEIKARKEAKKVGGVDDTVGVERIPAAEIKKAGNHSDLKEIALRVEGRK